MDVCAEARLANHVKVHGSMKLCGAVEVISGIEWAPEKEAAYDSLAKGCAIGVGIRDSGLLFVAGFRGGDGDRFLSLNDERNRSVADLACAQLDLGFVDAGGDGKFLCASTSGGGAT